MKVSLGRLHTRLLVLSLGIAFAGCSDDDPAGTGSPTTTGTGGAGTGAAGNGGEAANGGGAAGGAGGTPETPAPAEDWSRDILSTALELDLATKQGKATIVLAASAESEGASFDVRGLTVSSVSGEAGPLAFEVATPDDVPAQLNVGVPSGDADPTIVVEYAFEDQDSFDGWMPAQNVSFLWPYFCGNLFPCKSDPADGVKFEMVVTGIPGGLTAVYPEQIPGDAPSYMPAVAVAEFTVVDLGKTTAGTQVNLWHLPGQEVDAAGGTAHLREVFDFYETTYGAYTFGTTVGSVSADWGGGDYGGMEHHPYWHVSSGSIYSEEVHAHEAAHGWYGNGVRIACWEDFVLSEGTVTYMAAHALEELGVDIWADYECGLKSICQGSGNTIALPGTCNRIDIATDPLWSGVPYMKGAYFFKEVAEVIGVDVLDQALAEFYQARVLPGGTELGQAASMTDLVTFIKTKTDAAGATAVDQLTTEWLETLACPIDTSTFCP